MAMIFRFRTINALDAVYMIQDNPDFLFEFYRLAEEEHILFGWHGVSNDDPTSPPIAAASLSAGAGYAHFDFKDTPVYMELPSHMLVKIGWHSEVADDRAQDAVPQISFAKRSVLNPGLPTS